MVLMIYTCSHVPLPHVSIFEKLALFDNEIKSKPIYSFFFITQILKLNLFYNKFYDYLACGPGLDKRRFF